MTILFFLFHNSNGDMMIKNSIFHDNYKDFPKKLDTFETDILIIGGGLAGITTAFFLKDSNYKITLIDSNKIGHGATMYSSAKITYLQDFIYQDIIKTYNFDTALTYLESQIEGSKIIKKNITKYNINCDYTKCPSFILTNDYSKYMKEKKFLDKCNISYSNYPKYLDFEYNIGIKDSAVFNPVKYIYGLVNNMNINIYEDVLATNIKCDDDYIVTTNQGDIKAKIVVIATQYPNFIKPLFIPFKTHFEKSYIVAAKAEKQKYSLISNKPFHSIRFHNDYILYGHNAHLLNNDYNNSENYERIINSFKKLFNKNIEYIWFNQDVITNDYLPYIGEFDKNLYIASGFNTWGMTNSAIGGKLISDLILNKVSKYEKLFGLKRHLSLTKTKNFLIDTGNVIQTFTKTFFNKNYSFYPDNVEVINKNGTWIGIYKDELGIEHKVSNKCPHLKCNLIFNNEEKTWDCPCHSSRFDIDGNIIRGPAKYSIKIKDSK